MSIDIPAPLAIVGNLNVDQWVQTVDRFPRWDEELIVDSARIELAGSAGYMLQACRSLGMTAYVVSTIGDDTFGAFVHDGVRQLGFNTIGVDVLAGQETCLGMIFVGAEGQRGVLTTLGAHASMDIDVVLAHDACIANCAEVMFCGSYLLPRLGPSDIMPYAQKLRSRGQLVVFDPSWDPGGWSDAIRTETLEFLRTVDVYLPNETELIHLTDAPNGEAAIDVVAPLTGELIVKRGAAGAIYVSGDERTPVPGYSVEAINTIGAGDVFDIGYLYARRHDWAPTERLQFANALAAMVVAQVGSRTYPDLEAVRQFMEEADDAAHHDP